MDKKRLIKHIDSLSPELQKKLKEVYPYGYGNAIIRLPNAQFAVPLDTPDANYLVKIPVEFSDKDDSELEGLMDNDEGEEKAADNDNYEAADTSTASSYDDGDDD